MKPVDVEGGVKPNQSLRAFYLDQLIFPFTNHQLFEWLLLQTSVIILWSSLLRVTKFKRLFSCLRVFQVTCYLYFLNSTFVPSAL